MVTEDRHHVAAFLEMMAAEAGAARNTLLAYGRDLQGASEVLGGQLATRVSPRSSTRVQADVAFGHGELSADAAALTDVRLFRQPVLSADDVGPQSQTLPARPAVGPRTFGL